MDQVESDASQTPPSDTSAYDTDTKIFVSKKVLFGLEFNDAQKAAAEKYPRTERDIYHVYFLLRQRLPHETAVMIVNHAEYWLRSIYPMRRAPRYYSGNRVADDDPLEWIISDAPRGCTILRTTRLDDTQSRRVKRVKFTVRSCDQGWCNDQRNIGTTKGSWTWFEAHVAPSEGSDVLEYYDSKKPRVGPSHTTWPCSPPEAEGRNTWEKRALMRNLREVREVSEKKAEWRWDAADAEEREAVKKIKAGDAIALTAHAVFPRWVNIVEYAEITVSCGYVR